MAQTFNLMLPSTSGSLESYINAVNKIPLLSAERELELAQRFQADGDLEAARELVLSHLRFVVRVSRGYAGYGLAQGDLIQEGNIGLMKAVKRFDPSVGVRLVSFAVHWVKAEIHEFILKNWKIVKVATTKAQRKLFFNLRSQRKSLGWMSDSEISEMADDLGVNEDDVRTMEQRLTAHDCAFDINPADDDDSFAPVAYLADSGAEPAEQFAESEAEQLQSESLHNALTTLDERSRDIVTSRWLTEPKATLHQLADRYGISAERVRQLEKNAFKALRGQIPVEGA